MKTIEWSVTAFSGWDKPAVFDCKDYHLLVEPKHGYHLMRLFTADFQFEAACDCYYLDEKSLPGVVDTMIAHLEVFKAMEMAQRN